MTTTIELDEEIGGRIDTLAVRLGVGKAEILRMLVEDGIDDLESAADALATRNRIRRGEERTYSSGEVRRDLGLDD